MAKKKVPRRRTRGPGRQDGVPKGRRHRSGRRRAAKRVTEVRPIENRPSSGGERTKGQRQNVALGKGKARRGIRGSKKVGAKGWRKRRQRGVSPPGGA